MNRIKNVLFYLIVFAVTCATHRVSASTTLNDCTRQMMSTDAGAQKSAIDCIVSVGTPEAKKFLAAYRENHLVVDAEKKLWLKSEDKFQPINEANGATPVGITTVVFASNVIRRSLDEALAQLRLTSNVVEERRTAATELALEPTQTLAEFLRKRLDLEGDKDTRKQLRRALAKLDLKSPDPKRRITAANTIADLADVTMQETLETTIHQTENGVLRESDPEVRRALQNALSVVNTRQLIIRTAANTVYGMSLGSVLLLAALGLSITFGLMKVINMAHGELLMLGAYATHVAENYFARYLPGYEDFYLALAIPLAFVAAGFVGLVLERVVIRRLYGRPLETLLATWGLSLILIQAIRSVFGAQNVAVANPSWLKGGWELIPTVVIPYSRVAVLAFTAIVVTFVWFVLNRTHLGLKVRAVTSNREMAAALGIPTKKVDMWTFSLGSAVAGLGGVALSQLGNVGPELGQQHIVDSFMVVVLGGVGNLLGSVLGALGLGIGAKYLEPMAGAVLGKILILMVLILFIQWRPQGLFALKGRTQEM
jgi:urea transport system permease protein